MYYLAKINIFQANFEHNYAEYRGGAIYIDYGASLECEICDFEDNIADGYGGAVFVQNRRSPNGCVYFLYILFNPNCFESSKYRI